MSQWPTSHVPIHVPVLAEEVLEHLDPRPGQILVDGTFGGGGHARLLASKLGPDGRLIGLDRDPKAIAASGLSGVFPSSPTDGMDAPTAVFQADYRDLGDVLAELHLPPIDGVLLDIGLSSDQLSDGARGFSFNADGPLDLRFDPTSGEPASDLVNFLPEKKLADLIYEFGEERFSRRIARRICEARRVERFENASQLAEIVRRTIPSRGRGKQRIDPATRTFQALRIAVNDELGALRQFLEKAPEMIAPGGRVAIICFHSLEDRIVKHTFRNDDRYQVLTKRPVRPGELEMQHNPRSRSARLRVAQIG